MIAGSLKSLYRYPVKSFLGESCQSIVVNDRGLDGDRVFAITTAAGKLGSGKNTQNFQRISDMFALSAVSQDDHVAITFPDGSVVSSGDPRLNQLLSDCLKQPVTLEKEKNVSHFDGSPIHIITTSSLAWLQARLPESVIDPRRFRANLVLETRGSDLVEQDWIGKTLKVGEAEFKITRGTIRCVMTTLNQSELPRDPKVLKCIASESGIVFGVYADVIKGGIVRKNDSVSVIEVTASA